jgi:hypothetical protein
VAKVRHERTEWDALGVQLIRFDEVLEFRLRVPRQVAYIDVSLDFNDTYDIELQGADETRHLTIGPRSAELAAKGDIEMTTEVERPGSDAKDTKKEDKPFKGLARYQRAVDPPVEGVTHIRVRPTEGDKAYSLGHLLITAPRPTPTPRHRRAPNK